jgi:hypothetical protein
MDVQTEKSSSAAESSQKEHEQFVSTQQKVPAQSPTTPVADTLARKTIGNRSLPQTPQEVSGGTYGELRCTSSMPG